MGEITLEDEIEAVRKAVYQAEYRSASHLVSHLAALRSALARLEASRWRDNLVEAARACKMSDFIIHDTAATDRGVVMFFETHYEADKFLTALTLTTVSPPSATSEGKNLYRKVVDSDAGRALRESMKKD
jgi:hypothetical protein